MHTVVLLVVTAMAMSWTVAYASWTSSGSGQGSSGSVTTGAGNPATNAVSGRTVTLTWPASTYSNGVAVASYLVKRYDNAGTVLQSMTSGTCAALVPATTCTHTAVPPGSWRYSVTPAVGNWRGTESAKVLTTVGAPALTLTPLLTRATATLTGTAANFIAGESLTFRLDNTTSGTVLAGTVAGVATPTVVPVSGGGAVTVAVPSGTTAGAHTVYAVASPSGESASQAITVDNTPPPAPSISSGPSGSTTGTSATFAFSDTEAGVTFHCTFDAGTATSCTSGQSYASLADGSHTFSVTAVDVAGNTSTATSRTWTVDTTAPVNTITFPSNGSAYTAAGFAAGCSTPANDLCGSTSDATSSVATVRISLRDAGSGLYWDGSTFVGTEVLLPPTGTTSWTYTLPSVVIPDGSFVVRVYATDTLGNQSTATSTVSIDNTPAPPPSITTSPVTPTNLTTATFVFSDTEAGVTFRCTLDGGSPTVCTSPTNYTGLANGSHTFSVVALDAAGNTSAATTRTWTVDATAPSNVITFPVGGTSYNTVSYNAGCSAGGDLCGTTSDPLTGVSQVRVSVQRVSSGLYWNGTTFGDTPENLRMPAGTTSWSIPVAASAFVDGGYTVRVYATDGAGNVATTVTTFTMDTVTPPVPSIAAFPATSSTASITFSDTEAGVTFTCSLDGAAATACTSPTAYRALSNASHTFSVTATDAAGNMSALATRTWTVAAAAAGGATTFPIILTPYTAAAYDLGCSTPAGDICGTASATGGVSSVALSIRQVSSGLYWNGTAFASTAEAFVTATGTTSWSYALTAAAQTDGSYTVRYFVTAVSLDVSQPSPATTYRIDTTGPSGSPVSTTNAGGTAGKPERADTIAFTTNEQLAPASVLSGWTGSASATVVVRISEVAGNDVLTVWNAANTVQLSLGTVDLLRDTVVTSTVTFGLTGTLSSMAQSGSTITVTLGTASGTTTATGGTTNMSWSPSAAATDLAGNPMSATPVAEVDNDGDF